MIAGGDRWRCPKCGLAIGREDLREWAIRHMINLGRFGDPIDASNEDWKMWWDAWKEEVRADADAAEILVHGH